MYDAILKTALSIHNEYIYFTVHQNLMYEHMDTVEIYFVWGIPLVKMVMMKLGLYTHIRLGSCCSRP